jgi:hypothetical protein
MNKKIIYDFETTGINPIECKILKACFMFVENRKIINTISYDISLFTDRDKFKAMKKDITLIENNYNNLLVEEIDTLKFNRINNINEYVKHEQKSMFVDDFFKMIVEYYNKFKANIKKLPLTGWNNAGFDNIIMKRYFEDYNKFFDYHTRDIMHDFRRLRELMHDNRGLSLKYIHKETLGTIKDDQFHLPEFDCLAVKDLDEWFEDFFNKIELRY